MCPNRSFVRVSCRDDSSGDRLCARRHRGPEPQLTARCARGRSIADEFRVKPANVWLFLQGQLDPACTRKLTEQRVADGQRLKASHRSHVVFSLPLFALVLAGTGLQAEEINWQEAVARLARERTQAEACARVLKRYGNAEALGRGSLAYDEAKAEYDGVIAGLVVALVQKEQPSSLPDLQARLRRGFDKRDAFCKDAQALLPRTAGEKGVIDQIVSGVVKPLIDAVVAIYSRSKDDNALTRKTIQTQLEATSWPSFASVTPPP